jgi:hypothetical protein
MESPPRRPGSALSRPTGDGDVRRDPSLVPLDDSERRARSHLRRHVRAIRRDRIGILARRMGSVTGGAPMDRGALNIALALLLLAGVSACTHSKKGDLIFLGTVTRIQVADTGDPLRKWVVATRVDRVISGSFSGAQFSFAIHSPSRSGLEVGKQYRILATRVPGGYEVDQYQWRNERVRCEAEPSSTGTRRCAGQRTADMLTRGPAQGGTSEGSSHSGGSARASR